MTCMIKGDGISPKPAVNKDYGGLGGPAVGALPWGKKRSPNCCGAFPYGTLAFAFGGASLMISCPKTGRAAAARNERRVTRPFYSHRANGSVEELNARGRTI